MSNDEIIRYFNIDHDSDVTLVAQLKACFAVKMVLACKRTSY